MSDVFPCPACGKATRVCQDPHLRICALCRKVSPAMQCTVANAPKLKARGGDTDPVGTRDHSFGWLETEAAPNPFPCPACGKPTRQGQKENERVCSLCKKVSTLAEIRGLPFDDDLAYTFALSRVDELMRTAQKGTPEGDELEALGARVDDYERLRFGLTRDVEGESTTVEDEG